MRIAFIDYVLDPARPGASGLSDIVWNMARELAKLGDDVHIVGPYTVEPDPIDGITVHRFKLPPIGYRNIAGHILIVLAAWRVARRIPNLDAIHAPEYLTTGIIAPFSRVPVLLTTPGNIYERIAHGNPFDPLTTQVLKVAARSSARWCTLIDAISKDMTKWWVKTGAKRERIVMIPHGIDGNAYRPVPNARAKLGVNDGDRMLVFAGRLSAEKNPALLIRAMARIVPTAPDMHLYFVGDGPERSTLANLAESLGLSDQVSFAGQVSPDHMPYWYSAADAVVLPSASEALPRVMLESMACGSVFVGTRISGVVDHVRDGETGYLVDVGDEAGLARAILTVVRGPENMNAIRSGARAYVFESLSWPIVMTNLHREILSRVQPPSEPKPIGVSSWIQGQ
ncbi:MAG TPA: glycosyltransferase family 4 protein [Nitrolancea sp.]